MSKSYDSYHDVWIGDIRRIINLLTNTTMPEDAKRIVISMLNDLREEIREDRDN